MTDIVVPFNFTPRDYQLDMFRAMDGIEGKPETKKKRVFLKWPRRHGKDKGCWAYMCKEAMREVGNYFYVFPYRTDAERALWENIDKDGFRTLDHLPEECIKRRNNATLALELVNGSFIRFLGLDKPDNIRGIATKGVVFSEFAYQPAEGYKIFMPALRETGGWAIFQSTPAGDNHFKEMDARVKYSPNWYYSSMQCLWPELPGYVGDYISVEQLKEIQEEEGFTEEEMAREYGVSYAAGIKGAYYTDCIAKAYADGRIGNYPSSDHKWVDTFWDIGWGDDTSIWFRQVDGGRIVWVDYYEGSKQSLADLVAMLKHKGYRYRTHYLPHDGNNGCQQTGLTSQEQLIKILEAAGMDTDVVVPTNSLGKVIKPGVQTGINVVRSRFSKFYFNLETCNLALQKIGLYHRKFNRKTQVFLPTPDHDNNSHCADALRLEGIIEEIAEDPRGFGRGYKLKVESDYDLFGD